MVWHPGKWFKRGNIKVDAIVELALAVHGPSASNQPCDKARRCLSSEVFR